LQYATHSDHYKVLHWNPYRNRVEVTRGEQQI